MKAPKIVDLALDEKPTSEFITARIHAANPEVTILATYGKRIVMNENDEQTTGLASMLSEFRKKT